MPEIRLVVGENYTDDLKKRLEQYGISHGELARESGIDPTQLSRWFNKPMQPQMKNIVRLEEAVLRIRQRRRRARRAT